MNHEGVTPVVLESPVLRGYERFYPWLGLLLGAAGGLLVVHPLVMAVNQIFNAVSYGAPLQLGQTLIVSFYPHMWPMTLLYTLLGMLVGLVIGIFLKRLQEHRQQLQILHQDFETQVAALRHHYKNLAIGIQGFSGRIKRKLGDFDAQLHQCALANVPACQILHHDCEALTRNVDILEETAQRLTTTLNQEVRFLKALTSDDFSPVPQNFYPFLMRTIRDLLELRFREKEIRVEVNNRPLDECRDFLVFAFEPYTMEVILQNLLSNSMRYGDHIRVSVREAGNWVRVEISDNGPGLEVEKLRSHLLTPADRQETESTHLGLKVSLHLILRSGGRLSVLSEPGAGATFIMEVPRQPGQSLA